MENHLAQTARNKANREIANELSAPDLRKNGNPLDGKKGKEKPKTGLDVMLAQFRGD